MARLTKACPLFAAADTARAAEWYRDKLNFELIGLHGDYAIVRRNDVEIHFWKCDERHIAENTSAYFRVEDIDGVRESMMTAAEGGRVSEIADREWGMREFYVWDPDGNLLRFGQHADVGGKARA